MTFNENYDDYLQEIEKSLEDLDFSINYKNDVSDGCRYAILNQGKRIRPVLLLEFCNMFSKDYKEAIGFATALELIHNYSLVHDDLPSMDNDKYRRGKLTVHAKYGEGIGVLVGDTLLNKSYEVLFKDISLSNDDIKNRKISGARYLSENSGIYGMIGGQVYDIENRFDTVEDLLQMYDKKTCGLIRAACVCGAYIGGATDKEIELAEEFGKNLGLSFQIRDDLLDLDEDEKIGKVTYVSLTSKKEAEKAVVLYSEKAKEALDKLNLEDGFCREFLKQLIDREV